MVKLFFTLTFLLISTLDLSADAGSSHVIKARILVEGKECTGYFRVWGYLYLQKDSLESWRNNTLKFADQAKRWIYGDTLTLYSEIIELKNVNLIMYPTDKKKQYNKNQIKEIYPIDLIDEFIGRGAYSIVTSIDKEWLLSPVNTRESFYIESGAACDYTILYFGKPNKKATNLVKAVELELRKEAATGTNRYKIWAVYLEELKKSKVIIFSDCST